MDDKKIQSVNSELSLSKTQAEGGIFASPRQDFLASVVVFLVALPLCMGIAIASGVPVAAGLITGIVGGLIVGWFAGAPLQVSGPAAGLTVIVYDIVQQHGLEIFGLAVLIGGALQFVAGVFRYGGWFRAVSPAVIHGMLAGIGILILSSQFHVMVDDTPKGSGIQNILSIPEAIQKGLPLPEMQSTEVRRAKRDLLKQFGQLHEQQVQLRKRVAETAPLPNVVVESVSPSYESLKAQQKELADHLEELIVKVKSQDVLDSVKEPAKLREAAQSALSSSRTAVDNLAQGSSDEVRDSQVEAQQSLEDVFQALKDHDWAAKVGLLAIVALLLWKALAPKRLQLVPAPLVAVVVATIAAAILKLPVLYVEVPDNLWSEIHLPSWSVLQSAPWRAVLQASIVLAAVASAETLLCATAVDQMQSGTRTNYNRELAAQGVGNMVCGLLGALPMTGVIVRSSANVDAGAKTRLSTILHGAWLLVFVSFLAFILRMIPTAALAAMLVYIGYKLVNFQSIKNLRKYGWGEVMIYFVTVVTIVATDLLTGVLTGVGLAAAKLLYTFSHLVPHLDVQPEERKAILSLEGAATFVRLPVLAEALEQVPDNVELHVDFEHLDYIDHACLDLLINWEKQHEATGGSLVIDWDTLHASFHQENGGRAAKRNGRPATAAGG
ncbi:MAG: SulP family inorganic anion transporter [Pirellulales bacterium]|nr:SulP family inorganic anion transporter [Pirellulales bacterium]